MSTPTVADSLRLAHGVDPSEFDHVVAVMARLDSRLRSFPAGTVELELSVKERDTPSQRTTLEAWIAGQTRLVATSSRPGFDAALQEVIFVGGPLLVAILATINPAASGPPTVRSGVSAFLNT